MIEVIWCKDCGQQYMKDDASILNNIEMPKFCPYCGKQSMVRAAEDAVSKKDAVITITLMNKDTGASACNSFIVSKKCQLEMKNGENYDKMFIDELCDALSGITSKKKIKELMME